MFSTIFPNILNIKGIFFHKLETYINKRINILNMKLDKTDKKLISYLYHHYREPLTKIGKACRISRDQVEYRLKKYEKEGLFKKYIAMFNYDLFGYKEFVVVWLKIKDDKTIIKRELESMKNVISTGDALTSYDVFVNFVFKDKQEFEQVFNLFLEKHKQNITNYSIFITTFTEFYPLKAFGLFDEEKTYQITTTEKPLKLTEKDLKILTALEKNGRARIIDIAKQTGLSSELIVYKIRQLYINKIILGTRIQLGMEKLGFYFVTIRIKLKNLIEETRKKLKYFCKQHKHINALSFGISDYNCIIQIFYQNEKEYRQTIIDINSEFKKEIQDSILIPIENEGKIKTLFY